MPVRFSGLRIRFNLEGRAVCRSVDATSWLDDLQKGPDVAAGTFRPIPTSSRPSRHCGWRLDSEQLMLERKGLTTKSPRRYPLDLERRGVP